MQGVSDKSQQPVSNQLDPRSHITEASDSDVSMSDYAPQQPVATGPRNQVTRFGRYTRVPRYFADYHVNYDDTTDDGFSKEELATTEYAFTSVLSVDEPKSGNWR